ncbi:MAG: neutral zinc metallopeptidase [Geodermatophilaceae bacterium]|nr:neutral zinc metallopeptidase [Geodermatophilaceae bacterium]
MIRADLNGFSLRTVALACTAMLAATAGCTTSVMGTGVSALSSVTPAQLCPEAGAGQAAAAALVACISTNVSDYWTSEVGQLVEEFIDVDPDPQTVPDECRAFLSFGTAFYCPADTSVYITGAALERDAIAFGDDLPYAIAVIVAHEYGHVVQAVVHQPGLDANEGTDAQSRATEQQADCLAGVWVRHSARAGRVNPVTFRAAFEQELTIISGLPLPPGVGPDGYDEIATHGTVTERVAAYDMGVAGGSGTACGLLGLGD